MKAVSQAAGKRLDRLAEMAQVAGGNTKLDNVPDSYMPLCVEWLGKDLLSVAHYGEQKETPPTADDPQGKRRFHGDLMRDPDMIFWHGPEEKVYTRNPFNKTFKSLRRWYPVSFRNDYAGSYRIAIRFNDDGTIKDFSPREQADQATFTTMWMRNIWHQQGL